MASKFFGYFLALALVGLPAVKSLAQSTRPQTQPDAQAERATAEQVIAQLDDPDPAIRRIATLRINNLGTGALEPVEAAARDAGRSPEARVRLTAALKYLRPRAAVERTKLARISSERTAFRNAYLNGGNADPKFDEGALKGIDGFLALGVDIVNAPPEARQQTIVALNGAIRAGCDDPLVIALYNLTSGRRPPTPRTLKPNRGINDPAGDCYRGNYPAIVKFRVQGHYAATQIRLQGLMIKSLADLLPAALQSPDTDTHEVDMVLEWLLASPHISFQEVADEWKGLLDIYERLAPKSDYPLLARSQTSQRVAWEQRRRREALGDFQGARQQEFFDALKEGADLVEEACRRDPTDSRAPRWRLTLAIQLAEAIDTRADVEKWFKLTMRLNPDDRGACDARAQFLAPDMHGSAEEMIAFGSQCVATENWRGGIPFVAVSIHDRTAEASGDRQAYFLRPNVWNDLQAVYDGVLANYPDDLLHRCEYAKYCGLCGHWDVALQQFQVIGDNPIVSVFGSEPSYQYLRRKAERLGTGKE